MSASREKKSRQNLGGSAYTDPRKAREAQEKAKDLRTTRLYTAILVGFVLLGVVLFAAGKIQDSKAAAEREAIGATPAVSIDGEEYTVNDVSYYYNSVYNTISSSASSLGFDTSTDPREQQFSDDQTWYDYLLGLALDQMTLNVVTAHAAEAAGFDAAEEMDAAEQNNLAAVDYYASYNNMTRARYLTAIYGEYMTEDAFIRCVRQVALASAYESAYSDSLSFSDADLQAAYDADPKSYQSADIEYILFNTTLDSDATDEDKAAAQEENTAKAESALERLAQGESLEDISDTLEGSYTHLANAANGTSDLLSWAFDDARASGDTATVAYGSTGCYAVLFHDRTRDDYHTVSIRHILVSDQDKADEILSEYQSGAQTEDAFAALASANSSDSSASNGGLYTNIYKGQMVEAFEDWCFDPSRQPGDTGIVETAYGYHVIYFVGTDPQPYWQLAAENTLKSDAVSEWEQSLRSGVTAEQLDGIQYVG